MIQENCRTHRDADNWSTETQLDPCDSRPTHSYYVDEQQYDDDACSMEAQPDGYMAHSGSTEEWQRVTQPMDLDFL